MRVGATCSGTTAKHFGAPYGRREMTLPKSGSVSGRNPSLVEMVLIMRGFIHGVAQALSTLTATSKAHECSIADARASAFLLGYCLL